MLIGQNSQFEETQMIEKKRLAPRARFELATLRLTAEVEKNLSALSGVAYKTFGVIFPFLVAPNPAPKSGQHTKDRVRTLRVLSAIIEARRLC